MRRDEKGPDQSERVLRPHAVQSAGALLPGRPASRRLAADRRGSRGAKRARQGEHPEAGTPGKPRRALTAVAASRVATVPAGSRGPAAHAGGGARVEGGGAAGPAR